MASPARALQATTRTLIQNAKHAVRDVFDAIVELVTNSDDRYQVLGTEGVIEIELYRRRGMGKSILRVRDFADGMDLKTMERKLSFIGGRESGLDSGEAVRGTHSRGAKDVAALGRVVFQSIATDGHYHECEITPYFEFISHGSQPVTAKIRENLGIRQKTGTLVTIELDKTQRMPQHANLRKQVHDLVTLRSILEDKRRTVVLRDLNKATEHILYAPQLQGTERVSKTFGIPNYPEATAKLIIWRAKKRFDKERPRFRRGGIRIESRRAIHESTLFDSGLESDPHALWFYGKLVCPYIDDLCNRSDERFEEKLSPEEDNPTYLLDSSRRSGLKRDHPFTEALSHQVLRCLRPLVEEERKREESERAKIETRSTRRRLDALEKAALDFMRNYGEEQRDVARDPGGRPGSLFMERGYSLSPPFTQMVVGQSQQFWLTVRQETFPELEVGTTVQIQCLSSEISTDRSYCGLEPHPTIDGVLRATWKIKALRATSATGVRVRVNSINEESAVEVLANEAEKYKDVTTLQFSKKRYRMQTGQKRKVRILAPISLVPRPTPLDVTLDSKHFELSGQRTMEPRPRLLVSMSDLVIRCRGKVASGTITARLGSLSTSAEIASHQPTGADLSIKPEDIDLGNQRYRWGQNVLEIAARHPSLKRYLGDKEHGFPGQEAKHFRLLVAEVVADAVCGLLVSRNVQSNPEDYEDADWETYYAQYSKYMTQFSPIAHKLQCPDA